MTSTPTHQRADAIEGRILRFADREIVGEIAWSGEGRAPTVEFFASGSPLGAAELVRDPSRSEIWTAHLRVDAPPPVREPIVIAGAIVETGAALAGALTFATRRELIERAGLVEARIRGLDGGLLRGEARFGANRRPVDIVLGHDGRPLGAHRVAPRDASDPVPFEIALDAAPEALTRGALSVWFKNGATPLENAPLVLGAPTSAVIGGLAERLRALEDAVAGQRAEIEALSRALQEIDPDAKRDAVFSFIDALLRIHRRNQRAELRALARRIERDAAAVAGPRPRAFSRQSVSVEAEAFIGVGWHDLERTPENEAFRWMGAQATALLVFEADEPLTLTLHGLSVIDPACLGALRATLDDVELPVAAEALDGGRWRATIAIPAEAAASGDVRTLRLECAAARRPEGGRDQRRLSLALTGYDIDRNDVTPPAETGPTMLRSLQNLVKKPG